MSNFGENLKRLRDRQNITISTLSDMTGIARRTIYDWEKGKYIPASFSSSPAISGSPKKLIRKLPIDTSPPT